MTLLKDIRGVFSKKKPVVLDLTNDDNDSMTESKMNVSASGRSTSLEKAKPASNIEEVMGLVRKMSNHLETQTYRTDRLIECMERLPVALEGLPEANRQSVRAIEVMNEYLDHARHRDDTLNETLADLRQTSNTQTEMLGFLQQQFETNNRASEHLVAGLGDFQQALSQLAVSNSQTTKVLTELNETNSARETDLTKMLSNTQRWMIAAMVSCAVVSIAAIGMAGFAMFGG